jgi:hypothetical protein
MKDMVSDLSQFVDLPYLGFDFNKQLKNVHHKQFTYHCSAVLDPAFRPELLRLGDPYQPFMDPSFSKKVGTGSW